MYSWEGTYPDDQDGVWLLLNELEAVANDSENLINELDKIFTHGQLSDETRQLMRDALNPIQTPWDEDSPNGIRVKLALYLMMISPDYNCTK